MNPVLRAAAVYLFLMIVVRSSGRRTLGETTTFDFVLLLIISESIQNAMIGDDFSLMNAFLVVATLVGIDIALTLGKVRFPLLDKWIDGTPTILVVRGRVLEDRMAKSRVDVQDVLEAARGLRGLERLEQIKYAVLERDGGITIIPEEAEGREVATKIPAS